ncbi:N-acetylornithine carbamoyltransferase [Candidatus Woesearchaeota archaeon]|nr:N-acetylornithine carbamoyltransferase [Candidatus Woesearchaeota archaeon]
MKLRHFITTQDFSVEELQHLVTLGLSLKQTKSYPQVLKQKILGMLFFNPSLRTRASFEAGMALLGGHAINLEVGKGMWNLEWRDHVVMDGDKAEHIKEAAHVLSQYCDVLAVRAFPTMENWEQDKKDEIMQGFVRYSEKPVINMESSCYHPCQALADIMTMQEVLGNVHQKKFVLFWAYHPSPLPMAVPNSAVLIASRMGMDVTIINPPDHDLDEDILQQVKQNCLSQHSRFEQQHDYHNALDDSSIIYAKSWGSRLYYGNLQEEKKMRQAYKDWIVDEEKMHQTKGAKFMHCLPIRRNVVATDAVIDSPASIIYTQAANRLYAQMGLLMTLLGEP